MTIFATIQSVNRPIEFPINERALVEILIALITCEHGGNQVPPRFQSQFDSNRAKRDLASHRGYDPGALSIAKSLAMHLESEITFSRTSRLLVELNRSPDHSQLHSRYTYSLPESIKKQILAEYYFPYRETLEERMARIIAGGESVLHLSMHTFTRRFRGILRSVDIGVLYDPNRNREASFSSLLVERLTESMPRLRVRHNEPYRGSDDGFTTYLRTRFAGDSYLGIEIEACNEFTQWPTATKKEWMNKLAEAIRSARSDRKIEDLVQIQGRDVR